MDNVFIESELKTCFPSLSIPFCEYYEGYQDWKFGLKAGPEKSLMNLYHEIAHAIEFGSDSFSKRVSKIGAFEFKMPKAKRLFGQIFYENQTDKSVQRELRTIGIQIKLLEWAGYSDQFIKKEVSSFCDAVKRFMNDSLYWFGKDITDAESLEKAIAFCYEFSKTINRDEVTFDLGLWLKKAEKAKLKSNSNKLISSSF